jgi:phosphoenolpyruvate---glycerone phosphotransferase subunit DhaL
MEITMTDIKLTFNDIVATLQKMALDMKDHINELRELDAASGDGDLGVTVELGADSMVAYLNSPDESDIGKMLAKLGMNANKANPSTFGTLLASAFMGAGKAVQGKTEITTGDLVLMGLGAIDGIKKRGKSEVGDKTMLDSLVPAVETFRKGIDDGKNVVLSLKESVTAAQAGMQATANMKAKFGRASYRQDGCVGVRDGGATAMYFLIESFQRHLIAISKLSE